MSIAAQLNCLGSLTITVVRYGKGRIVGGKLKASKQRPFTVKAAVQPMTGRERESLPEGWRQRRLVKVYTNERLLVSDDKREQRADLLFFDDEEYEVLESEQHRGVGLDYFKTIAARRND